MRTATAITKLTGEVAVRDVQVENWHLRKWSILGIRTLDRKIVRGMDMESIAKSSQTVTIL